MCSLESLKGAHGHAAGLAWRDAGAANMALLFLNRYLDIMEAIEDALTHVDLGPIQEADVPSRIPLPRKHTLPGRLRDEVWPLVHRIVQDFRCDLDRIVLSVPHTLQQR